MSDNCEHVSRRVQKTKREIEQLKEELQNLIDKGANTQKSSSEGSVKKVSTFPANDKKPEEKETKKAPVLPSRPESSRSLYRSNISLQRGDGTTRESPKKIRHYNVEEAREYIRKQREKRLGKVKDDLKESRNNVDLRKEKLRELQKKSLELVQKNLNFKRDRSRSRDREKTEIKKEMIKTQKQINKNEGTKGKVNQNEREKTKEIKVYIKPVEDNVLNNNSVPDLIVNNFKCINDNIPKFAQQLIDTKQQPNLSRENAAIRIQRFYREYRNTKLTKEIPTHQLLLEQLKESLNQPKPVQNALDIPVWLTPKVESYPYNFINTVKLKLNFALNDRNKDVGVQIDMNRSREQSLKIKEDIRKSLESSKVKENENSDIKRFLSKNFSDLDLRKVENLRLLNENDCDIKKHSNSDSESDTSKNIPDISSESSSKHSMKTVSHSNSKSQINADKIKDLKLDPKPLDLNIGKIKELKLGKPLRCFEEKAELNCNHQSNIDKNKKLIKLGNESLQSLEKAGTENFDSQIINIDKIKELKLDNDSLKSLNTIDKGNFIEEYCLNSIKPMPVKSRSRSKSSSRSINSNESSLTRSRDSKKIPSPLQVPDLNLMASEPPSEYSNEDLKSFIEYMSNVDYKRHSKTNSASSLPRTISSKMEITETKVSSNKSNVKSSENYSSSFSGSSSGMLSAPSSKLPMKTLLDIQNDEIKEKKGEKRNGKTQPEIAIPNWSEIPIKDGEVKCIETKSNTNQIHLKFEAELHLLNDFNESMRQFMAVEKTILDLHSKNQTNPTVLQNQDTQTSSRVQEHLSTANVSEASRVGDASIPNVEYSRGTDLLEDFDELMKNCVSASERDVPSKRDCSLVSTMSTGLELSQLEDDTMNSCNTESIADMSVKANKSFRKNAFMGFSLGMFDQLIRDEDTRIENLKTILKIREKALLDRTKGELAWLEIQKKQLIETGQLHEASLLKKKQRGIIIKLQHEKQEMQRLKQIQKQASKERKIVLKEQRNMIKAQLSNNHAVPKIRRSSAYREKRQSGPVKVYNLHRETINTETSISRKNSVAEEIVVTSRSESIIEEYSGDQESLLNSSARSILSKGTEDAKKSLLMREAALQKRKKAAEELLQWHQRLLEEERKIAELEMAANTIIKQSPSTIVANSNTPKNKEIESREHSKFKGTQLNLLLSNMTGKDEKKFDESEFYDLSPKALEKFYKEATREAWKKELKSSDTEESIETKMEVAETKETSYSSDFDVQPIETEVNEKGTKIVVLETEIDRSKSTLNEIMENISNITDEISAIYKLSAVAEATETTKISPNSEWIEPKPGFAKSSSSGGSQISKETDEIYSEIKEYQTNTKTSISAINSSYEDHQVSDTLTGVENQKIIGIKIDFNSLDEQMNEILSEGSKRINDILRSRNHQNESSKEELVVEVNLKEDGLNNKINDLNEKVNNSTDIDNINSISEPIFDKTFDVSVTPKSKIASPTVLKSGETPKSNRLNSSVTLVKNLTELIKTGTSTSGRTPESENSLATDVESPGGTLGQLSSISNEPKVVETNDLDAPLCQIGIISDTPSVKLEKELERTEVHRKGVSPRGSDNEVKSLIDSDELKMTTEKNISKTITKQSIPELKSKDSNISNHNIDVTTQKKSTSIKEIEIDQNDKSSTLSNVSSIKEDHSHSNVEKIIFKPLTVKGDDSPKSVSSTKTLSKPDYSSHNGHDSTLESDVIYSQNKPDSKKDLFISVNSEHSDKIESESHTKGINREAAVSEEDGTLEEKSKTETSDMKELKVLPAKRNINVARKSSPEKERLSKEIKKAKLKPVENSSDFVDVKRRVSEILADANSPRGDKSPRLQDIYTTTYDILSPDRSPEMVSPISSDKDLASVTQMYGEEAEALFKKQLAIEQEIKQLEQQQKEQIPYVYMREIPNKPPPPYTPPVAQQPQQHPQHPQTTSVVPATVDQLDSIVRDVARTLHNAYYKGTLETVSLTDRDRRTFALKQPGVARDSYEYVFDLCKELAVEHYGRFVERPGPSWLRANRRRLARRRPFNEMELGQHLFAEARALFGFGRDAAREGAIAKWCRKKRDHIDEILIVESQAEEAEWTNYDEDEVRVKDELTNDVMKMLMAEAARVLASIVKKRSTQS